MDRFEKGMLVKIKSLHEPLDGKLGRVVKVDKWECDVRVGTTIHLIHKSQLTRVKGDNIRKSS